MADLRKTLIDCLRLMLKPVVRFSIRRAISVQEFMEATRELYVEVAAEELERDNQKVNISRLSVVSGLQRRAVERIFREARPKQALPIPARVIGQWRKDKRFTTKAGGPRVLTYEGDNSEFKRLVRKVSRELHPRSVLYDLERVGAVEKTRTGLRLKAVSYEPRHNPIESFQLLSHDVNDMICAVLDNIHGNESVPPNFHAASVYDNINEEDLEKIREWVLKQCSSFHDRIERYLAKHDLDITPQKGRKGGKRVVYGSFTRTT